MIDKKASIYYFNKESCRYINSNLDFYNYLKKNEINYKILIIN